jgi:hypothetical protein
MKIVPHFLIIRGIIRSIILDSRGRVNTVKKIAFLTALIIAASFLPFGCALVGPQADVTITGQTDEVSVSDHYKRVNYTIKNTGLYSIDFWEIQFRIEIGGNSYDEYVDGYDLLINEDHAGYVDIETGDDDTSGHEAVVHNVTLESD